LSFEPAVWFADRGAFRFKSFYLIGDPAYNHGSRFRNSAISHAEDQQGGIYRLRYQ